MGSLLALLFFVFAIIVVVLIAVAVFHSVKGGETAETKLPYTAKEYFFNSSEQMFFNILNCHLDAHRHTVFPKVRLGDLVSVEQGADNHYGMWARIRSRHVDFVVWDLVDKKIVCAIELDGKSHNSAKAKKGDEFKDDVFVAAGLPLHRVSVGSVFEEEIQEIVSSF